MASHLERDGHEVRVETPANYDAFFQMLAGGRSPYEYQRRMAGHLRGGQQDVLLTAPTGCGKTWSTLGPYLHARAQRRPFADRVLYALPLRALASSLKTEVERTVRSLQLPVTVTIQTGDQQEDELFDRGDIIFTTIDQLLSSYIHLPLSLPQRLANINAGALVGSLVVFDEAHLLEPERALQTLLHLMGSHRHLARFVLATATFTSRARSSLLDTFRGRMLEEGPRDEEIATIPVLADKRRAWTRVDGMLSADAVRALHRGRRTLVVVNTVGKAQEIGAALVRQPPEGAEVLVLHSRYFPHDRAAIEQRLLSLYGPRAPGTNVVLVATQVVEAGLDLSADLLLTEVAPVNALLQRAGRCARYVAPRNEGEVVVFDLERSADGQRRLGPYRGSAACLERTWDALATCHKSVLGGPGEATLLETALAEIEGDSFTAMGQRHAELDGTVRRAWRIGDPSALRELVRDVRAVSVFLADDPERMLDLARGPIALSIPAPTWYGFAGALQSNALLDRVLALRDDPVDESPFARRWSWKPMQGPGDWADAYCLSSELAGYHPDLGLVLEKADRPLPPVRYRGRAVGPGLHYVMESYRDHVGRVLRQAHRWLTRNEVGVASCAKRYGINPTLVRGAVLLAAGLHDAAKLDRGWQRAARAWQTYKDHLQGREPPLPEVCLAHTDYDPRTDREAQRKPTFQRPNHAVEGALAVLNLVDGWLVDLGCTDERDGEGLLRCILTSIAHHHSARAGAKGAFPKLEFELIPEAQPQILAPLLDPDAGALPPPSHPFVIMRPDSEDRQQFEGCFLRPDAAHHIELWPLYCFIVRGLRLSDQAGTREGTAEAYANGSAEAAP